MSSLAATVSLLQNIEANTLAGAHLAAGFCASTRPAACRILRPRICQPLSSAARSRPPPDFSPPSGLSRLRQSLHKARTDYPILFPTLLVAAAVSLSLLGLLAWDEYTRVAPAFSAFPPAVEQRLRLALHYTYISPDPDAASRYFREAIEVAEAVGMDPLGKEYIGLRIRYAECLEKYGRVKASIDVLSLLTKDLEDALAAIDSGAKTSSPAVATAAETSEAGQAEDGEASQANPRQDLLKRIIQNKVKIASLYDTEYVQDRASAKQTLSDAIQQLVSETPDAATKGFSGQNAAGLSLGEIAAMLSQMGDLYATSGEEANAVQTYMLALPTLRAACDGSRSCKEVQLLSNVAATMDQALKKPNAKINGKPATPDLVAAARTSILKWADQAIATVDRVPAQDRDDICDLALLSAQFTKKRASLRSPNRRKML
ncbi:hypothetical protein DV735_g2372, partial [Chaetothyriales sp. CBS 134920]